MKNLELKDISITWNVGGAILTSFKIKMTSDEENSYTISANDLRGDVFITEDKDKDKKKNDRLDDPIDIFRWAVTLKDECKELEK